MLRSLVTSVRSLNVCNDLLCNDLVQLLLRSLVTSVKLLNVCNVLDPVSIKITSDLSQITEGVK